MLFWSCFHLINHYFLFFFTWFSSSIWLLNVEGPRMLSTLSSALVCIYFHGSEYNIFAADPHTYIFAVLLSRVFRCLLLYPLGYFKGISTQIQPRFTIKITSHPGKSSLSSLIWTATVASYFSLLSFFFLPQQ